MEERCKQAYASFLERMAEQCEKTIRSMNYTALEQAAYIILDAESKGGRVHVSGIGKPAHIAGYAASLLSSTGTPASFLHGTEAVHGSCGQTRPGDVVIFISNSGETAEMRATVMALKNNGCRIIGISGNAGSWLAKESELHLFAGVKCEGGPLNRAPRLSILAETAVLQALSVILQAHHDITPQQYVCWHPGGALGKIREGE